MNKLRAAVGDFGIIFKMTLVGLIAMGGIGLVFSFVFSLFIAVPVDLIFGKDLLKYIGHWSLWLGMPLLVGLPVAVGFITERVSLGGARRAKSSALIYIAVVAIHLTACFLIFYFYGAWVATIAGLSLCIILMGLKLLSFPKVPVLEHYSWDNKTNR